MIIHEADMTYDEHVRFRVPSKRGESFSSREREAFPSTTKTTMERLPVEMIRLPAEEEEEPEDEGPVGRDAASVFPNEARAQQEAQTEQLLEAVGAGRFISETELEEIRTQGLSAKTETGQILPERPLAEVLAENKRKKEEEFQDQWKQMKQGKNRPLDADEFEFIDTLHQNEVDRSRRMEEEEKTELDAFKAAVEANAEQNLESRDSGAETTAPARKPKDRATSGVTFRPVARVRVVRKAENDSVGRSPKRQRQECSGKEETVLGGLLGNYDSGDEDENDDSE
ncbi:hypothetical protein BSKO_00876 [Bryopsis sp. KO-2023]|nr:hypothetical protein BSKO_00876 [Bryopsis sp. KO-2023]